MDNNIKFKLANPKGITLVTLVITVLLMIFIASITVSIGTDSLDEIKLKGFYMQLEIVQKKVDDIEITNENYTDSNGNIINIKEDAEFRLTESEKESFQASGINLDDIYPGRTITIEEFRYFTKEELLNILDLSEIEYNVFVHFPTRTVIAQNGITIKGKKYYRLENNTYFPEQNSTKNKGTIQLTYVPTKYGTSHYKINVVPNTVGDLIANGTLRYKKTTNKYWETANRLEIIVNDLGEYNIEYIDSNKNTVYEIIEVSVSGDGNPTVTVKK